MYEERFYRYLTKSSRDYALEVVYRESDLYIISDRQLDKSRLRAVLMDCYNQIEGYIRTNPRFKTSLSPLPEDRAAPPIIQDMLTAARMAGIGPFSAVAGAIAMYVGREALSYCNEIMVENGGDIFLKINSDKKIGLYLGKGADFEFVPIRLKPRREAFGICSSSAYIGHSLNFGLADLVTVVAADSTVADAFATAYSNRIKRESDIEKIMNDVSSRSLITGLAVAFNRKLYFRGDIELWDDKEKST